MKDLLKIAVVFAALLIVMPMLVFLKPDEEEAAAEEITTETAAESNITTEKNNDVLKVLDFTSGQVHEIAMRDYVIGAVLAEMPASYHEEALKAQAVAARTYAVRQREKQRLAPDELLMGADISNDSSRYQAYFTPEQAKAFYGDSYEAYYDIVSSAVDATGDEVLIYNGEPIVAAFHSTSGGRTESAEIVWGSAVEYLVPVESTEDENSPAYLDEKVFTENELSARIEAEYPDAVFGDNPEKWIVIGDRSVSGTVIEVQLGDTAVSGTEFRRIFSLKSANFEVEYSDENFIITTKGNGHGVGMSQYGANAMANEGADYREILAHYYTGAEIAESAADIDFFG
ncbi:MAG: stage II sporulation protein D [Oscillospiraceae bacterium]|nr:stage II sporulation protein D [Oscillospiraceae bacterium]